VVVAGCGKQKGRITMPIEHTVTLDEVLEVLGGEVRKSVDKYFDFLQKTVSSYPLGDTELGGKAKACAEKNITMGRDYMHKLSRATTFLELVPFHTEFMQAQLGFMGEQIKSLGEIYTNAATEVLSAPLPTDAVLQFTPSIIPPSVRQDRPL
jgi:Phasin protein